MRARNIKPGFYKNPNLVECSLGARLLAPGLWMMADREGRLLDRPKHIKMEIFPADNLDINELLSELHIHQHILRYEIDGLKYIQILGFIDHQAPHFTEKPSLIPSPNSEDFRKKSSSSQNIPKALPPDSLIPDSLIPDSRNNPPQKTKNNYSNEFEEFWKIYPKNGASKSEAYKSWCKAIDLIDNPVLIIAAVAPYAAYTKAKGIDVAHATTWLNQHRWEVDYIALTEETKNKVQPSGHLSFDEQRKKKNEEAIEEARKRYV